MTRGFVHLHNHTEYSMLDGAAKVKELMRRVEDLAMPAVAMTDHGNVFAAYDFWKAATDSGINPVVGVEAYMTPGTHRLDKTRVKFGDGSREDVSAKGAYTHMTLWAESTQGMHNLFRLTSLASLEGHLVAPRIDRELLATHGTGIIGTTGCPSSEVQTYLHFGKYQQALAAASDFRDILGPDNYYVELMDHGLDIERRVRDDLLRLARDLNLPLVATNDLHYIRAEDAKAHAALLCINSGSTLDDPNRFKFDSDEYYVKSAEQMRDLFRDLPEACDATLEIAERCSVSFVEEEGRYMPRFPVPAGESETSWFVKEVERGLGGRWPNGIPDAARRQAEYETQIITEKGYCGYFLVVADFINWAKTNGIRVGPGRGSGAGSICAYAMRITDLDPLQHGLIFERFLNPERPSLPDFDVDFDEQRRGEVIRYVVDKYGDDRVAQIVTFGTIKSRQAVKDANRVLGHPYGLGEQITKAMPPAVMGKDVPLAAITDPDHSRYRDGQEFRTLLDTNPTAAQIVETARGIEGVKRQWGVHAAGVIMSSEPLLDIIPVMKREADGAIITQFDYPSCEALGLVKMDFLGLRNLTILEWALANITANGKTAPVLEDLPLDDQATYRLMASGATLGVFQLDGGPMQALLRSMRPDCFEDISAVLALYRPGPMGANSHNEYADRKNDRKPITPIHPELAAPLAHILDETYGLIVYQEQVQEIAVEVAGYTLGTADLLRRAMGKKKKEVLDAEYVNFSQGMRDNGYSEAAIDSLWRILIPFSDYAFNKAHTAAYGLLAYWTAYLKAHYPAEYMAALLTSVKDDRDRMAVYLNECRRMHLTVLPPDVNESDSDFTPVGDDTIRFGLSAIRNVGVGLVAAITRTRDEKGKFADFPDYLAKCPPTALNKKAVDSLIKAGAFDSLGHPRQGLSAVAETLIDIEVSEKRHDAAGMDALFDLDESTVPAIPDTEWDRRHRLTLEREMLGLYVSDHPLRGLEVTLDKHATTTVTDILTDTRLRDATPVTVAGLITATKTDRSKRDDRLWATVLLEDLTGTIACLVFPNTYENTATHINTDTVCAISGKISRRDETPTIYVDSILPL